VNGVGFGMQNGLKGSSEIGEMLTQCKEAVQKTGLMAIYLTSIISLRNLYFLF
jgi:hypothetical protein